MSTNTKNGGAATFDDISFVTLTTLEQQILGLTRDVAATEGALAACQTAVAECEVRRDTVRTQADAARGRLGDGKNAAATILGAVKLSEAAHTRAVSVRDKVFQLLTQTSNAAESVLTAVGGVDDLVGEVETYRKNHLVSEVLQDGVAKAETVAQTLVAAAISAVEAAMSAFLAASQAETAAGAVPRQGVELWGELDQPGADPLHPPLKGVSTLVLGSADVDSMEDLARSISREGYSSNSGQPSARLLHLLANTDQVLSYHLQELEAAVSQGQLEINALSQRLANQKAALRSAQLALDGARASLGSQF